MNEGEKKSRNKTSIMKKFPRYKDGIVNNFIPINLKTWMKWIGSYKNIMEKLTQKVGNLNSSTTIVFKK